MKYLLSIALFAAFFAASVAEATVGGQSVVDTFKYNPADESVYFVQTSESGRGCPPILMKLSLTSGRSSVAFSCEQGEALTGGNYANGFSPVNAAIAELTDGMKDLGQISLPKNGISVDVDFVREEKLEGDPDWVIKRHFTATVYQDGKKAAEFPIQGCTTDQPFTFAGYAVPGFNKKIVLLLSTKGDCFEGGYTYETLHPVGGLTVKDRNYEGDWKGRAALVPSAATLVVFEKDEPQGATGASTTTEPQKTGKDFSTTMLVAVAALCLLAGIVSGYFFRRK